jgi:DNA-binding IclR family transcriptional regulator
MMRKGTPSLSSLSRALAMLEAIVADGGVRSVAAVAREQGVPVATAHRQVRSLVEQGYLVRHGGRCHIAGPRLLRLTGALDEGKAVTVAASPVLHRLAADLGCVVQLGTLDGDMVTYRIKAGRGAEGILTRVGMQLEAYCSGLGKVLLAALPEREREAYLASGPYPALTARTITRPDALRAELARAAAQGHAIDDREVDDMLMCIAVPVLLGDRVVAALSASRTTSQAGPASDPRVVARLKAAAAEIGALAEHMLAPSGASRREFG